MLNDCVMNLMNTPYTGTVAITDHGIMCQAWSAQYPNRHTRSKDAYFPADGSVEGASNYCRNFEGYGRPWCITVDQRIMWGFCTLRICNGNITGQSTGKHGLFWIFFISCNINILCGYALESPL